jgi:hypothetical protein
VFSWSWGWNKYGSIGNGSIEDVLCPTRIPIFGVPVAGGEEGKLASQFVVSINAGLRHTLALSSSQLLFGWGMVNLTNSTSPSAPSSPAHRDGSCEDSMSTSPSLDSRRRFSVFCDASSTSELYLTPTQIFYKSGVHNPFSGGKFLQLRGCSSSSVGYVTIDAEVPTAVDLGITASSDAKKTSATRSAAPAEEAHSPAKAKLAATANAVRRALIFTSPSLARKTAVPPDLASIADSSLHDKASSVASAKPQFNPFSKDFSSKKEEQAALAKKFREVARATKFVPGAKADAVKPPSATAGEKERVNTPSSEMKGTKRPSVTPTSLLKSVPTPIAFGTADPTRRSPNQPPRPPSPANSSSPVPTPRSRIRMSLTRSVYNPTAAEVLDGTALGQMSIGSPPVYMTDANGEMHEGAVGAVPFEAGTSADSPSKQKELTDDDLLDLFSPLHLTSIRTHRGQRKRDVVKGSSVRDYFAVFEQKDVPLAPPEDTRNKRSAKLIVASGVGMPNTEKTFLAAFASSQKGGPVTAIEPSDGHINPAAVTLTTAGNATGTAASLASYQTPTLSYSWRLAATRRRSTASPGQTATVASAAASAMAQHRPASPQHSRREWSPPPRRASTSPLPTSRTLSPKRAAGQTAVDPSESAGIDKAIEKLTKGLGVRDAASTRTREKPVV